MNSRQVEKSLCLGVDPGYTGALALYDLETGKLVDVYDMPIRLIQNAQGKKSRRVHESELAMYIELHRSKIKAAIIEEVGARPKQGLTSTFNFGFGAGVIQGVIASHGIPIFTVKPAIWKLNSGLTSSKNLSLEKAKTLFPEFMTKFLRQKDNGRAEAAILAKYGEKIFGKKKFDSLI